MDVALSHAQGQRALKQRNLLALAVLALTLLAIALFFVAAARNREIVLQPVIRSPLTISSAGVSREYLELVTRDTAVLILNRNPQNLEYWMGEVLRIASPRTQGRLRADLMKIVNEQRGSSIAQFFTIEAMKIDPDEKVSEVSGQLHTIVGEKVISKEHRIFRFTWEYSGLTLRLLGFGMVRPAGGRAGALEESKP